MQLASRAITAVVLLEVLILLPVLVCEAWVLGTQGGTRPRLSPFTGIGGFSLTAVLVAASLAVLPFPDFDALATCAKEATGGLRRVGRATMPCQGIAGVLFVPKAT